MLFALIENKIKWKKVMTTLDSKLKSRDITLPTKVCLVKAMVFPVVMYGCECWTVKKAEHWRCFWTVMLEKTLESPLDCKEIQPVHPKEDQSWVFIESTDAEAETPILWPPHANSWLIGKDSDAGRDWEQEKGTREDLMTGWHHWLDGDEFGWTLWVGDGQGGLACCNSLVAKSQTWLIDWPELNPLSVVSFAIIFSHSVGCPFTFLIVSFAVQRLLSLIRPHLFTFVFISISLGGGS